MPSLDLAGVSPDLRPTATWASALVHALARAEAASRMPRRLTEPGRPTWDRFRGRLTSVDLLGLLFEDAAVLHGGPFRPASLGAPLRLDALPERLVDAWLADLDTLPLTTDSAAYVLDQARRLGLPTRLARSDLHIVKPHQRVLELPGTAGQLAFHLVTSQPGLTLQDNLTVACDTWQERTLAAIVALELNAPRTDFILPVDLDALRAPGHPLRARAFDLVVGLHPDKGGLFRVDDQLALWFPNATIVLV
jgi:hypothetical protein